MKYFAYGSNIDENRMQERCPKSRLVGKARLEGYKISFSRYSGKWNGGVADIIEAENSHVWGILYEITEDDLARLDKFEGHPNIYIRKKVIVIDDNDQEIEAFAYEVVDKKDYIPPSPKYLSMLKSGAYKYNFPKSYQIVLDSINCTS